MLHSSFNMAQHCHVDENILNEITSFPSFTWVPFSEEEFTSVITKCNNSFTPGPDKLLWSHLKHILKDKLYLKNIIKIANACLDINYWLFYFKTLTTIVILKLNKAFYNMPKYFKPIVLLNILGKLIKKVISDRLQFHAVSNNFIYQSQLGKLKFKSMLDAGIALTYFIYMGWVKNLLISILAFDIAQFFPSLNHHLLTLILGKADFNSHIIKFFSNYFVSRKIYYF